MNTLARKKLLTVWGHRSLTLKPGKPLKTVKQGKCSEYLAKILEDLQFWDSLYATPYSHYKARLKYTWNLFRKCLKLKGVLIFDLKHRSKESILWAKNSRAWLCEERLWADIGILVTSKNDDEKTMQSIRLTSRPYSRMRKWNKLSEFRWTSTKIKSIEKTKAGYVSKISQGFKRGSKWRTNSPTYPLL